MPDDSGKLAHLRLRLPKPELDVAHRAGIEHQVSDALFPLPANGIDKTPLNDNVPFLILAEEMLGKNGNQLNWMSKNRSQR